MRKPAIESGSSERRRHVRYPFTGTLEAVEPESETKIQGRTTDLSESGCYVDTLSPFPALTRVKVRLTRGKRSFESQATIIYSVVGMGMGLRFEAVDPKQLAILRKWLGELSGESTPESGCVLNEVVSEFVRKGALNEAAAGEILTPLS
jgi:PilZ domain